LRRPAQDAPSLAAADRLPVAATLNIGMFETPPFGLESDRPESNVKELVAQ
jgi:hypothetical protein